MENYKINKIGLILIFCMCIIFGASLSSAQICRVGQPCDDGVFCNGTDTCAWSRNGLGCYKHAGNPCGANYICDEELDTCFGPGPSYGTDFLETGNPGGWDGGSLKTFDTSWKMNVGETVDVDIWINDMPENQLFTGGLWITFDPAAVNITSVKAYDGDLDGTKGNPARCCPGLAGPWDPSWTIQMPDAGGPGTYFLELVHFDCVTRDAGNGIILARVTFQSLSVGDTAIVIQPIPEFDTNVGCATGTFYDPITVPAYITIIPEEGICLGAGAACHDGLFCNGDDTCGCAGSFEQCCTIHAGDPCGNGEQCDEVTDECIEPCTLSIAPSSAGVYTWEMVQFGATVDGGCNDPCFTWSIAEQGSTGSTINTDGLYTAGWAPGVDVVQVTDVCNNYNTADAYVVVTEPCTVTINPSYAEVYTWEMVQFGATVDGGCNDPCFTWSIAEQGSTGSTISADGLYTAGWAPGVDIVQVTDVCNNYNTSYAMVYVITPGHIFRYERPIPMGVSISPTGTEPYIMAGTAGMLVRGINSGLLFILSNNHVMGAVGPDLCPGTAPFRTPILQPGTLDIGYDPGAAPEYTVAHLFRKAPLQLGLMSRNKVDAAIALTRPSLSSPEILELGFPTPEVGQAEPGMGVIKSGRTTAVTTGFVETINATVRVSYGGTCGVGRFVEQVIFSDISNPGDSGSVILDFGTFRPVALLFAGSATSTVGNPFSAVVEALNVVPVGANGEAPSYTSIQAALEAIQSTMNPTLYKLKEIQQKYEVEIMSIPKVVGMGIGSGKSQDDYEFIVYCEKIGPEIENRIPRLIDGVPVRLKESGPFQAY